MEVLEDGCPLPLGRLKERIVFAVLLLHANEFVSRERLIDEIWGVAPPPTATKAVNVYVSRLRKTLTRNGHDPIATADGGYRLVVDPDLLDAERVRGLVASAHECVAAGDSSAASQLLEEALAFWRGPTLAGLPLESFGRDEVAQLEELRLTAVMDRIDCDLAQDRHERVLGELQVLVREHPLRERLRAQQMLALYRADRQADALEAYQQARHDLIDELGIEPSESLQRLQQAILQHDPALEAPTGTATVKSVARTAAVPPPATGVFVGRERELAELLAGLEGALSGRGRLFLISGEPGIGKSRLVDELANRAGLRGAQLLVGRSWEAGGAPAFWPWIQALRTLVRERDPERLRSELAAGAPDLAQLLPELRELLPGLPEPPSLDSEGARFRLFDAVASFLRATAETQPLLVVLDDLHAADEPSLLLLQFVARELPSSCLLVVGAYRDVDPTLADPLAAALTELAREPVTRSLVLGGLAEGDVARFIEETTERTPTAALVDAVFGESEGNPLFVGEIVRLLEAEGRLNEPSLELAIPRSVKDVIGRRLRRLSDACNRILVLASVLGREFDLDALARVSGLDHESLLELLDEALSERVVSDVPVTCARKRFAHVLIRDTLYDGLKPQLRTELHHQVVETLEKLYGDEPGPHLAELAHHAVSARDFDKGLSYAQRAGDRALALLAFEEAARLYGLALQVLDLGKLEDPGARCELLLRLGEAQARKGDAAASTTFLEAAQLARSAGFREQLARAALGYGGRFVWMISGRDENIVPLLEDALRGLGEEDSALRARVLARLAGALRDQPAPERRAELSAEAVEIARRLGDFSTLAYVLDGRHSAIWGPDNIEERLTIVDEIVRLADEIGDRERKIQGRFYRAFAQLELGDAQAVHEELHAMERLADELRQPAQQWYVAVLRTILALFEGRFEEARALVLNALDLAERGRRLFTRRQTYLVHREQGLFEVRPRDFVEVQQTYLVHRETGLLDEVVEETERSVEEMPTVALLRFLVADLYCRLGRKKEAQAILDRFAETDFYIWVDNDKLAGWCLLAEVCSALDDSTHASRLYELLLPHAGRNAVSHPVCAFGSVSRYLGLLASTLGRFDDAECHFEAALEMNERMGAHPWVAHTEHDYARVLLARGGEGDKTKAVELLGTALATARELAMEPLAGTVSALLTELERVEVPPIGDRLSGHRAAARGVR
jgi:DNA-binding SARP family transcriptional activator/tetratricopeptide (TPR) repeat protein